MYPSIRFFSYLPSLDSIYWGFSCLLQTAVDAIRWNVPLVNVRACVHTLYPWIHDRDRLVCNSVIVHVHVDRNIPNFLPFSFSFTTLEYWFFGVFVYFAMDLYMLSVIPSIKKRVWPFILLPHNIYVRNKNYTEDTSKLGYDQYVAFGNNCHMPLKPQGIRPCRNIFFFCCLHYSSM